MRRFTVSLLLATLCSLVTLIIVAGRGYTGSLPVLSSGTGITITITELVQPEILSNVLRGIVSVNKTSGGGMGGGGGDRSAPRIYALRHELIDPDVVIYWVTNEYSTGAVDYWYDDIHQQSQADNEYLTKHKILLAGLRPGTEYSYQAISSDESGNTGQSDVFVFMSPGIAPPEPVVEPEPSVEPEPEHPEPDLEPGTTPSSSEPGIPYDLPPDQGSSPATLSWLWLTLGAILTVGLVVGLALSYAWWLHSRTDVEE